MLNKEIRSKINPKILRSFFQFQQHYKNWMFLRRHLQKRILRLPANDEVDLIYFLEYGIYPPWVPLQSQISSGRMKSVENLAPVLLGHQWTDKSLHHWTFEVDEEIKEVFLEKSLSNSTDHFVLKIYANMLDIYIEIPSAAQPASVRSFEISYWRTFFRTYQQVKSVLTDKFGETFLKLWQEGQQYSISSNQVLDKLRKHSSYAPQQPMPNNADSIDSQAFIKDDPNLIPDLNPDDNMRLAKFAYNEENNPQGMTVPGKWSIENAGLIIVYPFLSHLFKTLGYLDSQNRFGMKSDQIRAVYLLHYLATEQTGVVRESELAICKLLCNMDISEAIPPDIQLTQEEMRLADELLTILISRWEKLGKCSPEALRNTFIRRNGILEKQDHTLQLTLEQSGTDILLEFIPWNTSMIQLPWLDVILLISWI